jgi:hypothetical protein
MASWVSDAEVPSRSVARLSFSLPLAPSLAARGAALLLEGVDCPAAGLG